MHRILALAVVVGLMSGCASGTWPAMNFHDRGAIANPLHLPEPALQPTPDGAVALASYYVESVGSAITTGDWQVVRRMSDPSCATCAALVRTLEGGLAELGTIERVRLVVDSATLVERRAFTGAEFGVAVESHPAAVVSVAGLPTETLPGHDEISLLVWVDWRRGGWAVVALTPAT
jgi:hypothetical protein